MSNGEMTEALLEEICYVIDILPARVSEQHFDLFQKVEEYYLQETELDIIADKFVNIVIKLQCYHRFEVFYGIWHSKIGCKELANLVRKAIKSEDGFLNMLCRDENMLITVNGQTLHLSVYNPPLEAIANLSMLATSEGLFMRRAEN